MKASNERKTRAASLKRQAQPEQVNELRQQRVAQITKRHLDNKEASIDRVYLSINSNEDSLDNKETSLDKVGNSLDNKEDSIESKEVGLKEQKDSIDKTERIAQIKQKNSIDKAEEQL